MAHILPLCSFNTRTPYGRDLRRARRISGTQLWDRMARDVGQEVLRREAQLMGLSEYLRLP